MYPTSLTPTSGTFVEQQIKGLKQIGIAVNIMFVNRVQKGIRAYLGLGRRLRSRVAGFQPHLVHAMYGGVLADIVTRTVDDRPAVVSFCGSDLLGERLSSSMRKLIAGYGVLASRRAARRAQGIVVKSKNLQNALPDNVDKSKVRVIPNGIDLERFKPLDRDKCRERLGWRAKCFHILFPTNSGDPCKRFELARAAVEALRRSGIQTEIHELRGVPHPQVPVWLNASDAVLLTSLHEGSPNIVKETLACNIPVVSVDVGDVHERLQGIEGCYIALSEPYDLAVKLRLVQSSLRRVTGRVQMQKLSLREVALQLKAFYGETLSSYEKKEST
jgi:glycosyltransferase involved in cell wall biosynthesis